MSTANYKYRIHPQKFALFVASAGIIMMFAGLTSAYLVKRSAGGWLSFPMPSVFQLSTLFVVLSSTTLVAAFACFKRQLTLPYRLLLTLTWLMGLAFLYCQYLGWTAITDMGIIMGTNSSGDFLFMISGIHALHVVGGVFALFLTALLAWISPVIFNDRKKLRLDLAAIYWHFVGGLWLYLYFFVLLQN